MSNELTVLSDEQKQLVKDVYFKGATDNEAALAIQQINRLKLDPVNNQVHFIKRYDGGLKREVMKLQVSIDGYRLIAERTGRYRGQTIPLFCGKDRVWHEVWIDEEPPLAAKIGIYREGFEEPVYAVAKYSSYVQRRKEDGKPTSFWATMPDVMLAKCAESLALRKAFPNELSGVYTDDEMGQADNVPVKSEMQKQIAVSSSASVTKADVDKMLKAFDEIKVDEFAVLEYLKRETVDDINSEDIVKLREWFREKTQWEHSKQKAEDILKEDKPDWL